MPPPSPAVEEPPSKPSKRKPGEPSTTPPRKKKKLQLKRIPDSHPRYFSEGNAFKSQEDVIIVPDTSDMSLDDMSGDEDVFEHTRPSQVSFASASRRESTRHVRASPSAPLADSSDDEDSATEDPADDFDASTVPSIHASLPDRKASSLLSTFQPTLDQNTFHLTAEELSEALLTSQSEKIGTVFVLRPGETVVFLGTYSLTVLLGTISAASVILTASRTSHRVFAPRSSPLPVLECVASDQYIRVHLPPRVRTAAVPESAVVLLQELHTGVEGLGIACRTFEDVFIPSRWQRNTSNFNTGLEGVHLLTHQTLDISPLVTPASWKVIFTAVDQRASERQEFDYSRHVYLIKGPRNSGKSTFARCLLNRLTMRYRRVAFLECDIGQSEFTPGGMVALNIMDGPIFGPPFTHPSIPHSAHYVGATSPRSSPSHYLDSIQALTQTYNLDIQHVGLVETEENDETDERIADAIPLVVNTMGWTKGLGADLSRKIEELVEPSDIFEFETQVQDEGWASSADGPSRSSFPSSDATRRSILEAVPPSPLSNRFTPADHRTLSVLSYFHAKFPYDTPLRPAMATSWNITLPLCSQPPYEVDWNIAFDRVILAGAGTEDVVPSEIARVMNLAVVGLVSCDADTLDGDPDGGTPEGAGALPYMQGAPPPSPSTSRCCGLALVRALSPAPGSSLLHILTPLPPSLLSASRVLVKGELELPVWGMIDFRSADGDVAGVERGNVPYLRWGKGEGAGGERRRVRRNLMRRGQM